MNGPQQARVKELSNLMRGHMVMAIGLIAAITLCLWDMATPSLWEPVMFAVNVMLFRLNAGRYLWLRRERRVMMLIGAFPGNAIDSQQKGAEDKAGGDG